MHAGHKPGDMRPSLHTVHIMPGTHDPMQRYSGMTEVSAIGWLLGALRVIEQMLAHSQVAAAHSHDTKVWGRAYPQIQLASD